MERIFSVLVSLYRYQDEIRGTRKKEIYTYIFPSDFQTLVGINMDLISGKMGLKLVAK